MITPLRSLLKRVFYRSLCVAGEDRRRLRVAGRRGRVAVLNLHRVSPHPNPYYAPMHPRLFADLLSFLALRCRVCTFDEIEGDPDRRNVRPAVVLSFDDGYHDFVEYALPCLERYRYRVNQNVIVESVTTGRPPWTIALADFLHAVPVSLLRELRVPGFDVPLPDSDYARARYGARLSRYLKMRPRATRAELFVPIQQLMSRLGGFPLTRMMSLHDVRAASCAHHIGAHSYSHESMGYESDAYFTDDLAKCRQFFTKELGQNLDTYAFPNGSYRPGHIRMLQHEGVRRVLLVDEQLSDGRGPVYPRLSVAASSLSEVRLQVAGFAPMGAPRRTRQAGRVDDV